ncbi:cytochrome c [Steroidobacter agaridevorans]|uniref:Cytochrome c n=1 Tax=Steroidobacter agaridevorans TaxID=2695856 RepID=A0A829YAQ6_9GAMM|nr:c-type cytochrome [Steroidobacter agaridevorans]GFE80073.1 cytochrome c [Steroidobacter agaridevorans]
MTSITRGALVRGLAVALATGFAMPTLAAEVAPAAFNNHCRTCHSVKEGDNRLGPSLHNIHGAKAGSSAGFAAYSQGMKSSGVVWDDATLDKFIENPDQVIPNNNMKPYKGIGDAAVRKQIVDFLRSASKPADG